MKRGLRCVPVTLRDGSVVFVRSRDGEISDEDRAAIEAFAELLKKSIPQFDPETVNTFAESVASGALSMDDLGKQPEEG